jgi:hypothetical protein
MEAIATEMLVIRANDPTLEHVLFCFVCEANYVYRRLVVMAQSS